MSEIKNVSGLRFHNSQKLMFDLTSPDWNIFYGQFFFTRERQDLSPKWIVTAFGKWFLYVHQQLSYYRVFTSDRILIGGYLGYAVAASGHYICSDIELDVHSEDEAFLQKVEDAMYTIGGRWAFLLWTSQARRFYVDSGATLAVVYSAESTTFASTTTIINVLEGRHDLNLITPVHRYRKTGFQYGDLTAFGHIAGSCRITTSI